MLIFLNNLHVATRTMKGNFLRVCNSMKSTLIHQAQIHRILFFIGCNCLFYGFQRIIIGYAKEIKT